jgi:hypothetical protein
MGEQARIGGRMAGWSFEVVGERIRSEWLERNNLVGRGTLTVYNYKLNRSPGKKGHKSCSPTHPPYVDAARFRPLPVLWGPTHDQPYIWRPCPPQVSYAPRGPVSNLFLIQQHLIISNGESSEPALTTRLEALSHTGPHSYLSNGPECAHARANVCMPSN